MSIIGTQISTPGAWKGPDIEWMKEGLHIWSDRELQEIDLALKHLLAGGDLDFPHITRDSFPLDSVAKILEDLPRRLRDGRGFLMLRGLPRAQYSDDDMTRIYFGLGAYIGRTMTQSYLGDILGHVMDVSDYEPKSRGYRKGGGQLMHTDSCDIIGLMCLRSAVSGGESRITSAVAVHNVMAEQYPEQLDVLARGLFLKRADEDGRRATRTFSPDRVPFFYDNDGELVCYLPTGYARLAEKSGQCPFTPEESEALYRVRKVSASPELYLDMGFKEGDIQFLNNRMMVHGRTDYQDAKELEHRRHLMRLWLEIDSWPAMPEKQIFHTVEDRRLWSQHRQPQCELPSFQYRKLREGGIIQMVD